MSGPNWQALLDCNEKTSQPRSTLANAVLVIQHDPDWAPAHFYYDEFLHRVLVRDGATLREWRDDDDTRLTVYMQQTVGMLTIPESQVASAARYVARQRVRHCVREYLASLEWDKVERIAHAFEDHWGVTPSAQQPCDYVRAVSANFFKCLVARVLKPGCQVDTLVIFEGGQGIGKAKALRALGGAWYAVASESVMSKDFFQIFPGVWLLEIGEMESFSRAERERVKLIVSTPIDRYRPTYARHAQHFPRQIIFAGTCNRDDYGNDDTGLRRFWPIVCGEVNPESVAANRDQLFAEAYARVLAAEPWWVTPDVETKAVQRDRQSEDVWTPLVLDYLIGKTEAQIHLILGDACKLAAPQMTHTHKLRIGSILRLAGWTKSVKRLDGRLAKIWVAPSNE